MNAIRIEHPVDGLGLWMSKRISYYDMRVLDKRHMKYPTAKEEFETKFDEHIHYCAYKSISQVHEWIKPLDFEPIKDAGFQIWLLDLSECLVGNFQIVFEKKHIITRKNISSLF